MDKACPCFEKNMDCSYVVKNWGEMPPSPGQTADNGKNIKRRQFQAENVT